MFEKHKIVRVFIGSPGGLEEERAAAHEVVDAVNRDNSEHWGCSFKLLGWENTIPGYQRPQSKINQDLDMCDYFIGVLWNRWGSRPSTDPDGYTSGFEEEFTRAQLRIENKLMKDMAIYFKAVEVPPGLKPDEDLQRVLEFRQNCINDKNLLFKDFESIDQFKDILRAKLTEIGWNESDIYNIDKYTKIQSEETRQDTELTDPHKTQSVGLIDLNARTFLAELIRRPSDWDVTNSYEIARFRLVACSISRSGNDDSYLGNHDANLIFQYLRNIQLTKLEISRLIDSGVIGFNTQNVPLWCWLAMEEKSAIEFHRLRILATMGSNLEKRNSLRILQLLGQPIPTDNGYFNKKRVLASWFSARTPDAVFDAAISFLASNGEYEDIEKIEESSTEAPELRKEKIERAIVCIIARIDINIAMNRICDNNVEQLESWVVKEIFKHPSNILTETVTKCLFAKPDEVRIKSAQLAFDRDAIDKETAENLLTDNSREIRLVAAEVFCKIGRPLEEDVLRKALTIEKSRIRHGLFDRTESDTTYFEKYLNNRLENLRFTDLQREIISSEKDGLFATREFSMICRRFSSRLQGVLRKYIVDEFVSYQKKVVDKFKEKHGVESSNILYSDEMKDKYRLQYMNDAIAAICSLNKSSDLEIVRRSIDGFKIEASDRVLKFLARFGEWQDIDRIIGLSSWSNFNLLANSYDIKQYNQSAGMAILSIARNRIADLLEYGLPYPVRLEVIKQLSIGVVKKLSDDVIIRELSHEDDSHRVAFAIRCILALPKSRIISLQEQYSLKETHRFYNSVHWLDLGASLPNRTAKSVAKKFLSRL